MLQGMRYFATTLEGMKKKKTLLIYLFLQGDAGRKKEGVKDAKKNRRTEKSFCVAFFSIRKKEKKER